MITWIADNAGWLVAFLFWGGFCVCGGMCLSGAGRGRTESQYTERELRAIDRFAHTDTH